jgi:SAM-dependent methyltransferase
MGETVGATGSVLAVDANPRFLSGLTQPNVRVIEADIRTADLARGSFGLAHARFVLIHVAESTEALTAMLRALKPGGWLVLEEPDFSCSRALAGPPELRRAFENVHRAIEAMFRGRRMDHAFGARLPATLQEHDLEAISIENEAPIVPGGSPQAVSMASATRQLRDTYVATGLATEEDIEGYGRFAADPRCWATYHATIRAAGRKPA